MGQNETNQGVCFRKEEREPSWDTDLLDRKDAAHQLERLIANAPGPYVIAMTSEWGSGKTFFLKAWEKDLLARKRPCVYFNAWETDHAGDPLLALTGCITESLKKQELIKPKRLDSVKTTASKIVSQAPSTVSKIFVGLANHYTDGALEDVKEVVSDTMKLGTDLFLKNNARRKNFTKQLATIAKEATDSVLEQPEDPINGAKHFPLFIMIDELDRCRPSYVIELLENIKHLFGVPGVVFLLAIDQDQILGVIQHTFGLCDANGRDIRQNYLRKFIDVFWKLPEPDAFTYSFYTLKTKNVPIPNDWTCQPISYWEQHLTNDNKTFFDGKNLFYAMLGMLAKNSNSITLRGLSQHIDRYRIISLSYPITTREAFIIFKVITIHKSKESDLISKIINSGRKSRHYAINTNSRKLLDSIFSYLNTYVFDDGNPTLRPQQERTDRDEVLFDFIKDLIPQFSGENLYESVMKKIDFLDAFDFGESLVNVHRTSGEAHGDQAAHLRSRPHQDQADH